MSYRFLRSTPALLLLVLVAACEPRSETSVVETPHSEREGGEHLALAPPCPANLCARCPQDVGPNETVLRTNQHRMVVHAGNVGSPRRIVFREISSQDDVVGVQVTGLDTLRQGAQLTLSYDGCDLGDARPRVARWRSGPGGWALLPDSGTVDAARQSITVEVRTNSMYAVATN